VLKGSLRGILARTQIRIDRLEWDRPGGKIRLELTSAVPQTILLGVPKAQALDAVNVLAGASEVKVSPAPNSRQLVLPAGEKITLELHGRLP
jgi:hypothetical protein